MNNTPHRQYQTKYPHIFRIDIEGNGILTECAVLKRDRLGNITFIRIDQLDQTDLRRIFKIVSNRNAPNFELWDIMHQTTLGNGMNALKYFHQLAMVLTPSGALLKPDSSRRGYNPLASQSTGAEVRASQTETRPDAVDPSI